MKKILIGLMILVIFMPVFLLNKSLAERERLAVAAEKAVILFMQGEVKVKTSRFQRWMDAEVGTVLSRGDNLKTGIDSWAEIGFGEDFKNVVRIKEETLVELIDLGPIRIGLLEGEIRSLVERLKKDSSFEIKTPTAVCGARGTGWDTNTDGREVVVDAYEDEVYFYPLSKEGSAVEDPIIKAGKRGILKDPTRPITIKNVPRGRMRDWRRWKEDFAQRSGIERGIRGKVEKIDKAQKPLEELMKGKKSVFERDDQEKMDRRLETPRVSNGTCP